jgi:hypothetical protein
MQPPATQLRLQVIDVQATLNHKGNAITYLFLPGPGRYIRTMIKQQRSPEADLIDHHLIQLASLLGASHPVAMPPQRVSTEYSSPHTSALPRKGYLRP